MFAAVPTLLNAGTISLHTVLGFPVGHDLPHDLARELVDEASLQLHQNVSLVVVPTHKADTQIQRNNILSCGCQSSVYL